MAFSVKRSDECPATRPWAVVDDDTGEVMACHATEPAAMEGMAGMQEVADMPRSADRYGQHGHAIMHPDPRIRDKARRYVDGQLPDLPPMPS